MWFEWFEIALGDKNRKNLLWVCERLDASCCYEWFCLLVSELTVRQIHSYQHPTGSHTQRTINHRYAQKPFFDTLKRLNGFDMGFEMFERFAGVDGFLSNNPQTQIKPNSNPLKPSQTLSNLLKPSQTLSNPLKPNSTPSQLLETMKRRELAQQYFPHLTPKAAVRKLTMWIDGCKELKAELCKRRDIARIQDFTVREVKLIKQYLDDP